MRSLPGEHLIDKDAERPPVHGLSVTLRAESTRAVRGSRAHSLWLRGREPQGRATPTKSKREINREGLLSEAMRAGCTLLWMISGAKYSGVPHSVQVLSSTLFAKPKSVIFK